MLFKPHYSIENIFEITPETLRAMGVDAIIFDLDETLAPSSAKSISAQTSEFIQKFLRKCIPVVIVSNNSGERVSKFLKGMGFTVPFIAKARKPFFLHKKRLKVFISASFKRVAVVGDKVYTDVCFANRIDAVSILVRPLFQDPKKASSLLNKIRSIAEAPFRNSPLFSKLPSLPAK